MRPLLPLSCFLIGCAQLLAQDSLNVVIKAGNKINEVLTPDDIYYYPQFTKGEVFYRGGTRGTARMNYTLVYDEMLFINPKGDTLALADEKTIKFITINRDTFYYDEGYVKLIADNAFVKFAVKQVWVVANIRKPGPHNTSTSSADISSVRALRIDGEMTRNNLTLNEDIVLRRETRYYFGDEYNHFVRPTKKSLQQLFPKKQRSIETYLKENKVDLNKKNDLENLFHFLSQLH